MPIKSFECADTEACFPADASRSGRTSNALRKLDQLNWSSTLDDMRVPPGNRFEALKGNRKGQHSVRINDPWRVCFVWSADGAGQVEIVDYH